MKITCFTAAAPKNHDCITLPATHTHTRRKAAESICFKNMFLAALLGGFRRRYMTHLQPQSRKNHRRRPRPFVRCDDAEALSPSLPLKGEGGGGGRGERCRGEACTPRSATTGSGGINQDDSRHALTSDPPPRFTPWEEEGGGGREGVCVRVCARVRRSRLVTGVQIEAAVPSKRSVFMSH